MELAATDTEGINVNQSLYNLWRHLGNASKTALVTIIDTDCVSS